MQLNASQQARRGAIIPMVALCLVGLLGMVALAIDIGMVAIAKNQAQNAADSAACATVRTFTGVSSNNYNLANAPGAGMTAAGNNSILGSAIAASSGNMTKSATDVYVSGPVTLKLGGYYYIYNDSNSSTEAFTLVVPGKAASQPYSAVTATVSTTARTFFGSIFGTSAFNVIASATAAYRPRDIVLVTDMSGSMRFESLPGGQVSTGAMGSPFGVRNTSFNPDPNYPVFGHYSDTVDAALQGTGTYPSDDVMIVPSNYVYQSTGYSPAIVADYMSSGTTPAFTAAPVSQATTPAGDNYLQNGGSYAKTISDLLGTTPTMAQQLAWCRGGYQGPAASSGASALSFQTGSAFNGYTAGPSYWGKTFFIWPPDPKGSDLDPSNTANHANNGANDWRQRFFFKVNSTTGALYWLDQNSVLFNPSGTPNTTANPIINRFGSTGKLTTVTENGQSVTYYCLPNYAAIFQWLKNQSPTFFPTSMLSGRIQFYSKIPDPTGDSNFNNRFWTSNPMSDLSERFWKDYVDFMLGQVQTGAGTYANTGGIVGTAPFTAMIGNGDLFQWGTFQVSQKQDCDYTATINNAGGYASGYSGTITMNNVQTVGGTTTSLPGILGPNASSPLQVTGATNATPIVITTSGNHGLSAGQSVYIAGVQGNTAANGSFVVGTSTGTTFQILTATGANTSGNGAYTSGGILTAGITAASNTSPIQITTAANHNLSTGQFVYISGVNGNTAANGLFQVTYVSPTQFTLNNSTGNGAFSSTNTAPTYTPVYWARFGGTESSGGANYYGAWFYSLTPSAIASGSVSATINNQGGSPAGTYSATYPALDPVQTSLNSNLGALANGSSVQLYVTVFPYYMSSTDNPYRPKHQLWLGPQTWVDWLGNYSTYCYSSYAHGGTYSMRWAGNTHESQAWSCKIGLNAAISDIQINHPADYLGLVFFNNPYDPKQTTYPGFYNGAIIPLGQNYSQMQDSLWFPPSTVTGTATSVTPYDSDFLNTPRAQGGTAPGMAFMIAYNMLSSSTANLRTYTQPQPTYRGFAGGLGRKGAQRLIIFETDGSPNWEASATLSGSGSDSYYPIRLQNSTNFADSSNVEFPTTTGSYLNSQVYGVVQQICAQTTATPPGFSTSRKPAQVYCIGYGSLFNPSNSTLPTQSSALTFLQTVQYYGGTSNNTSGSSFPSSQLIYGSADPNATPNRSTQLQSAIDNILVANTSVSLLQ